MNPVRLKLILALLWLIPGFGFLAYDWLSGQTHTVRVANFPLPIAWAFLLFGAFNLLRWWVARPARADPSPRDDRRRRLATRKRVPRRPSDAEPDPDFRFDEPPTGPP